MYNLATLFLFTINYSLIIHNKHKQISFFHPTVPEMKEIGNEQQKNLHNHNHKVWDIHVCQQESIIYIPLKKHLTIHSTWDYGLVLKALNYIIVGDSLDPLRLQQ